MPYSVQAYAAGLRRWSGAQCRRRASGGSAPGNTSANSESDPARPQYHALLHKIFGRAVIDRIIPVNPCAHTELPKVLIKSKQIITVEQFDKILSQVPARYRMMVILAIETGLRWGELVALRPVDLDFDSRIITVSRTIVEVAKKNSPTGERCFVKDYPKDDEQRLVQIERATCKQLREHMLEYGVRDTDLLFTSTACTVLSRNNFRTKYWAPAVKATS